MSWYYKLGEAAQGPMERGALANLLRTGTITAQIEVSEDTETWTIAARVPGLMDEVYGSPTSAPAPAVALGARPQPSSALPGPSVAVSVAAEPADARPQPSSALPGPSVAAPVAAEPTSGRPQPASELATPEPISMPTSSNKPELQAVTIDAPSPSAAAAIALTEPGCEATSELAATGDGSEPAGELERPATPEEPPQRTGPVGHIVLNPAARQQAKSRSREGGTSIIKLSVFGLLGLAAVLAAGFFTATKVFGLDLRPASVDNSVSKFMIEKPVLVVRADLQSILDSKVYKKSLSIDQRENNPLLSKFSYLKDTEDIVVVSSSFDPENPSFLGIINLKRDYRTEFVANLLKDATTEYVGDFQMHIDPNGMGGQPLAISLPEPRTLLVGSPYLIKTVLDRNAHPKLYPRASELIASTKRGSNISVALSLKPFQEKLSEFRDKLKGMSEQQREFVEKGLDDAEYITDRVKSVHVDFSFGETVDAAFSAECGSEKKAAKIAEKLTSLMSTLGTGSLKQLGRFTPLPNGTMVEITTSFDPSNSNFGNAILQGFAQGGAP